MRLPNPEPVNSRSFPRIVWVVSLFLLLILFVSCNRPEVSKEEKRAQNIGDSMIGGGGDNMEKYKYMLGQAHAYQYISQEISNLLNNKEQKDEQGTVIDLEKRGPKA